MKKKDIETPNKQSKMHSWCEIVFSLLPLASATTLPCSFFPSIACYNQFHMFTWMKSQMAPRCAKKNKWIPTTHKVVNLPDHHLHHFDFHPHSFLKEISTWILIHWRCFWLWNKPNPYPSLHFVILVFFSLVKSLFIIF